MRYGSYAERLIGVDPVPTDCIKNVTHADKRNIEAIKESHLLVGPSDISDMAHIQPYLRHNGIESRCFWDNESAKQGPPHIGLSVYGYADLKKQPVILGRKYTLLITAGPLATECEEDLVLNLTTIKKRVLSDNASLRKVLQRDQLCVHRFQDSVPLSFGFAPRRNR